MTEPENSQSNEEKLTPDEKKTMDIYHFFSRWDMMLFAAVVIILLLVGIYLYLTGIKTA